jgi:hypothetical protein
MLHAENLESVKCRYSRAPEPDFKICEWAASRGFSEAQIVMAADCLDYQSCEHPEWENSEAYKLLEAIKGNRLVDDIAGSEHAVWHIRPPTANPYLVREVVRMVCMDFIRSAWPDAAGVKAFGLDTREHYEALKHAVFYQGVTPEELDAALGYGPALTQLIREGNPYHGITFRTAWDTAEPVITVMLPQED